METRPVCLEFVRGNCELKDNCPKGHIEVENQEEFLKEYMEKNVRVITHENQDNKPYVATFQSIQSATGTKKMVINTCASCSKGFSFDSNVIPKGSIESICCKPCIAAGKDKDIEMAV